MLASGPLASISPPSTTTTPVDLPVETIGSKFGGIPQSLPAFALPDFDWSSAKQLLGSMLTLAVLGSIESLLCARVADTMSDDRHDPNQEMKGQALQTS